MSDHRNGRLRTWRILVLFGLLLVLAVAVSGLSAAPAGRVSAERYIVQMEDLPVVAYDGGTAGLQATKPAPGEKIDPQSAKVRRYVDHLEKKQNRALRSVGAGNKKIYGYFYSFNGFAADLTEGQVQGLAKRNDVVQVWKDEEVFADTSTTPDFLGLTEQGGAWDMGYVGEDVIIGIVDSGIWPEAMSFDDRTGTNPNGKGGKLDYRQIPGWHGKCVPGEEFNASMCNQKLIGAQYYNAGYGGNAGIDADRPWEFNSPRDYNGHGTHTASTAGGNKGVPAEADGINLGTVNGMAPRARIAMYKALWSNEDGSQSSGFTTDLVAAIDQAVADGVDVINYSISGSRTTVWNSVQISFLYAADAGIFIANSAGNSGPDASTVAHNNPWVTTVAAGTHDRYYAGTVTLGDGSTYDGASIDAVTTGPADLVYAGDAGDPLCAIGSLDSAIVTGKIVVCDRGIYARVDKSYAVREAGGIGMILANVSPSSINADLHYVPTVHVDEVAGDAIRTYAQEGGGSATLVGGIIDVIEAPFVASFSSRGPSLASADLLKPDIMAPGVDILAAVAPPGNRGRNFDFYSGTSMSSPHIAGIGALMKQAHPDWSPMMIKSALMTTAATETNMGNPILGGYFDYGAGQVVPNSAFDPGLVYDAGWLDWLGFLCDAAPQAFANPAESCANLALLGIPTDASNLNYPSIAIGQLAGTQTVVRTVTNVGTPGKYQVSVDAPPGIDVVVDPESLTLGKGESASYMVTFTANTSALLGEWTFGSLTWTKGQTNVTSPIALYPVAIAVPAEISGAGVDGSASFDVVFGYEGPYTAAAHGLEPAIVTVDNVVQDPDQIFDPTDGYSNRYDFDLSGAAYFRVALPPDSVDDPNIDLDLFVYDPGGDLAGSSGNGGTNELVDIALPMDGTWSVYVHGWGTVGPSADFTMYTWVISATPGGNMSVDSAPSAAFIGETGTVDVSWTGATAGEWHLGAVSHSDGGLLGLTLVNVDNR